MLDNIRSFFDIRFSGHIIKSIGSIIIIFMEFEKTNWILFPINNALELFDLSKPSAELNALIELQNENGEMFGVGVEVPDGKKSNLLVLDFWIMGDDIKEARTLLRKKKGKYLRIPFSDEDVQMAESNYRFLEDMYDETDQIEFVKRVLTITWSVTMGYPISSMDHSIFASEPENLDELKIGDMVKVGFKGGKEGCGIFAGVGVEGKETRILVSWVETFFVNLPTETVTFQLGTKSRVPHSSIEKMVAA